MAKTLEAGKNPCQSQGRGAGEEEPDSHMLVRLPLPRHLPERTEKFESQPHHVYLDSSLNLCVPLFPPDTKELLSDKNCEDCRKSM